MYADHHLDTQPLFGLDIRWRWMNPMVIRHVSQNVSTSSLTSVNLTEQVWMRQQNRLRLYFMRRWDPAENRRRQVKTAKSAVFDGTYSAPQKTLYRARAQDPADLLVRSPSRIVSIKSTCGHRSSPGRRSASEWVREGFCGAPVMDLNIPVSFRSDWGIPVRLF